MEKKSLKYWKIFAVILIALNITLIVFLLIGPPNGRPFHNGKGNGPGKFLMDKLKFNESQKNEFAKLRDEHRSKIFKLQAEGKKLRDNFFSGLKSEPAEISVDSAVNKIAQNQKEIELVTYEHFKALKNLCTPEQKIIFNEIIQDVIENMGNQKPGNGKNCNNSPN